MSFNLSSATLMHDQLYLPSLKSMCTVLFLVVTCVLFYATFIHSFI